MFATLVPHISGMLGAFKLEAAGSPCADVDETYKLHRMMRAQRLGYGCYDIIELKVMWLCMHYVDSVVVWYAGDITKRLCCKMWPYLWARRGMIWAYTAPGRRRPSCFRAEPWICMSTYWFGPGLKILTIFSRSALQERCQATSRPSMTEFPKCRIINRKRHTY